MTGKQPMPEGQPVAERQSMADTPKRPIHVGHLIAAIALPLAVGGVSALLTSDAMAQFGRMNQPPLSPPAWLFPVAWTILYVLMGIASYLIWSREGLDPMGKLDRRRALIVYGLQLALNFCWSLVFFGAKAYYPAFGVLVAMWLLIVLLMLFARKLCRPAMYLLVPYLLWTTFAGYLNLGVALLN
jgi:tryptophan-rich sensory protein